MAPRQHSVHTLFPKDRNCEVCVRTGFQPHQYSPSSSHELPMEPRAKVVPGPGKHSRRNQIAAICLRTKITRASCRRRRLVQSCPRAEDFGDLATAGHKKFLSEVNHVIIIDTLSWHKIWPTQWIQSYLCKNKNFSGDPEKPNEVPGADQAKTKSHLY